MNSLSYNERSWAIDLISAINAYTATRTRPIARAGGEMTLSGKRSLFPDVLLYGDQTGDRVRHGWELKMPDTPLYDDEFIENAKEKAERLRVNSFLLWNVNEAALYIKGATGFIIQKTWGPLGISHRRDVRSQEKQWTALLHEILSDLNDFFEDGTLKSAGISDVFNDSFLADIIRMLSGVAGQSIERKAKSTASFEAKIRTWWILSAGEYQKKRTDPVDYDMVSTIALTNWVNRILFCHYLKKTHSAAKEVEKISIHTKMADAMTVFTSITNKCDFLQVFKPAIATEEIGDEAWGGICAFNAFLTDLQIDKLQQTAFHEIIERSLQSSRRKAAGQYPTPMPLATLLAAVAMEERHASVLDPCCGTGTIARAIYTLKRAKGQTIKDALATTWASDKFQFPLQLSTIALADPKALGEVIQVFQSDILELATGTPITFVDPITGQNFVRPLPLFQTIVSNLPFVRFEDLKAANPVAENLAQAAATLGLSRKSDLFAYIIHALDPLLQENGRIGVIISNAWLGTVWGKTFRKLLRQRYHIRAVITSGNGRWFDNADVVTNILVLQKRAASPDDTTVFVATTQPIAAWQNDYINGISDAVLLGSASSSRSSADCQAYSNQEIQILETMCNGWSSLFADIRWLPSLKQKLIKASSLFVIGRGERRGWNPLFYPESSHSIEQEYILPALRSTRTVKHYIAAPNAEAFCCSDSMQQLRADGKKEALRWIKKFINDTNEKGVQLTESLARSGHHWYEMKPDTQADMIMSMNPGERLFVARMQERGFVDQRLIRLTMKDEGIDLSLAHALLNSILGLFFIEASGFGRGLGALDLSTTMLESSLLMWDPNHLNTRDAERIKELFAALCTRDVLPLPEEMMQADRIAFDESVFDAYNMSHVVPSVRSALLTLYNIRNAART